MHGIFDEAHQTGSSAAGDQGAFAGALPSSKKEHGRKDSIVVLLSFEIGATLLLLGAQVIAEYERIGTKSQDAPPRPLRT